MSTRENIRLIARAPFTFRKFYTVKNSSQRGSSVAVDSFLLSIQMDGRITGRIR